MWRLTFFQVDKLQFVLYIKEIPTVEGRNAELALWRRCPDEAEKILVQAGLFYRAIRMHVRLYNWDRFHAPSFTPCGALHVLTPLQGADAGDHPQDAC